MMKKICMAFLAIVGVSQIANASDNETKLLRFPATNGKEIVFSYAGDLYRIPMSGGEATRLTSHIGYEMFPKYSPDGKSIAFSAQYDGNTEVYTIPAEGGEPLRLTYTATNARDDIGDRMGPNNIVMTWTKDGENIIYRNRITSGFFAKLKMVNKEGGLSEGLPLPEGGFCSYSPDGKLLAYNRTMREFRTWKHYTGGMADDVWIYDEENGSVTKITDSDAQDIIPMWIGDEIYFISDRDRTMNMFVYNCKTKQTSKVTNFTDYDIKFPSTNGEIIVFEQAGSLFKFDPKSKKAEKITVSITSDKVYARGEIKKGANYITATSLSGDGKNMAVTARGEVFSVPVGTGATKNISRSAGANDRGAKFSPDGESIAYISDITGETEIYIQSVAGGEPVQATKDNDTYIRNLSWSPDSKTIIYTDRNNRMNMLDVASKKSSLVFRDPYGEPQHVAFSADSKWITYTRKSINNFNVVYAYNIAKKTEYAISDDWFNSNSPVFSTDGKYIIFVSARDFNPTYSSTEWNHSYSNMNCIYVALLSKDTPSPLLYQQPEGEQSESKSIVVDAEGIQNRIVRLPISASGGFSGLYSDGKKIYYNNNGSAKVFDLAKKEESVVAEGAYMSIDMGSDKAIVKKGKSIYVTDIPANKANLGDAVDLSNMIIKVDYKEEWAQVFDEAWRAYRDGFYDATMHGVDWKAIKDKYSVFLPHIAHRLDLNYIIGEMIGELTAGHCYVNPGEVPRAERVSMGLLGAEISRDKDSGYFRLEKILKGVSWDSSHRSPLTEAGLNVNVGDYIVAIDGVSTNSVKDMYQLLVGKADVPTELTISKSANTKGARSITILPISDESALYHNEWVEKNIATVTEATDGKIGYIYIPDMGVAGLNEFVRYFYPQLTKEGLIIDDRMNGGGNVSPMLIERLKREAYSLNVGRGTEKVSTIPQQTHVGPKVCLINKYSASDGDLFPWRFRANNLGKLIGTRTWGGIIGIGGSLPYMDGTDIRVPGSTCYDPKTGDWIIENYGVNPDIIVDNDPIKEMAGEDEQLNRAIEEVMKELESFQKLPGRPEPRVWNK